MSVNGDLNNLQAIRARVDLDVDPAFSHISLGIPESQDDAHVRARYRPFLLHPAETEHDWVDDLELGTVAKMVQEEIIDKKQDRLRILVLYGSLRSRYDITHDLWISSAYHPFLLLCFQQVSYIGDFFE